MLTLDFEFHNSNRDPVTHRGRNSRRNDATLHGTDGEKLVEHGLSCGACARFLRLTLTGLH